MEKVGEEKFRNSGICSQKVKQIIAEKQGDYHPVCYRAIKHYDSFKLKKESFFPTFIERNNGKPPSEEKQIRYPDTGYFGTSLYFDVDLLKQVITSITSLRQSVKCIAKGATMKERGICSEPDNSTHFEYYLFDPFNNNPVDDFSYLESFVEKTNE